MICVDVPVYQNNYNEYHQSSCLPHVNNHQLLYHRNAEGHKVNLCMQTVLSQVKKKKTLQHISCVVSFKWPKLHQQKGMIVLGGSTIYFN